ncbi:MAG TPA: holin [Micromonosporaceae bacterium]
MPTFLKALLERALKTFVQTFAAALVAGGTDLLSVGWKQALLTAALAAVASVVTSLGSAGVGEPGSPSLVSGER